MKTEIFTYENNIDFSDRTSLVRFINSISYTYDYYRKSFNDDTINSLSDVQSCADRFIEDIMSDKEKKEFLLDTIAGLTEMYTMLPSESASMYAMLNIYIRYRYSKLDTLVFDIQKENDAFTFLCNEVIIRKNPCMLTYMIYLISDFLGYMNKEFGIFTEKIKEDDGGIQWQ